MDRYWENGSGYYDPTAKQAIEIETATEKARNKQIHDTIYEIKELLKEKDLVLVGRIVLKDTVTNKKYK